MNLPARTRPDLAEALLRALPHQQHRVIGALSARPAAGAGEDTGYQAGTDIVGYKVEATDGSIGKISKHSEE
ncbi:hypothetical protein ACFCW4_26345, partial [Streptomyces virginiae]